MFDKFEGIRRLEKQGFTFTPTRFEIWIGGKMTKSGKTTFPLVAEVTTDDIDDEIVALSFNDSSLHDEIAPVNEFDDFISITDRLQLFTIPDETNADCIGITAFQNIIGSTRGFKHFNQNEAYCCNLFLKDGIISKVTLAFSNPEKLIEFYYEPELNNFELEFVFESSDHLRYENGVHTSGPSGGARRAVKVEPHTSDSNAYTVTLYNLDGNHPVWQNNIQMAPKQMKIIETNNEKIVLRGYGHDSMGGSFSDYGLTINLKNGQLYNCILHMLDRKIDIVYLP